MANKKQIVPFGRLATNASPFKVEEGSLVESKNVLHRNGVLTPRNGWKRHSGSSSIPMLWTGAGPTLASTYNYNDWRHRVLKIFEHSGSIYGLAVRGNPNSSKYTERDPAVTTGGYIIFKFNESKSYTYWSNPANYGTSTSPTTTTGGAWELSEHAFQYLMEFDGRSEMVPQIVTTKTALLITTAQGVIACPTMLVDEPAVTVNGYNTPGQKMRSVTPSLAGCPTMRHVTGYVVTAGALAYVLNEGDSVAYRIAAVKRLPNGSEVIGEPSPRCLVRNDGTSGAGHVQLKFIPPIELWQNLTIKDFVFRIFRTKIFPKSESGEYQTPDETYYAIDEMTPSWTPTSLLEDGIMYYNDILSLQADGESITISSSEIVNLPSRPPHARAIGLLGDRAIYGDILDEQRTRFSVLAVDDDGAVANSGLAGGTSYGPAGGGDFVIIGPRVYNLFKSTGTTPAVSCADDIITLPVGAGYDGVANSVTRVNDLRSRLLLEANKSHMKRFQHFYTAGLSFSDIVAFHAKLSGNIDLNPIGPDNAVDAEFEAVVRRKSSAVASSIVSEVFGNRVAVGTTAIPTSSSSVSPIMPTPVIDASTTVPAGKAFIITELTNAGTFTTSADHGLSVGDQVWLAVNSGCEAIMRNRRMPFDPGFYVISSVAASNKFTVFSSTHDGTSYVSGTTFKWTAPHNTTTDRVSFFIGGGMMTRRNSDGAILPTMSSMEDNRSSIAWSNFGTPQEVPRAARMAIGSPTSAVMAIADVGAGAIIFKEDGIFMAQESYASSGLVVNLLADGIRLISKHSFCAYGGYVYAWTTKGVFKISEGGVEPISLEIDDTLRRQYMTDPVNNRLLSHMAVDSETGNVILWTVGTQPSSGSNKKIPTDMWVYDGVGWQRFADSSSSAFGARLRSGPVTGHALWASKALTSNWINYMELRDEATSFGDETISLLGGAKVSSTVIDFGVVGSMDYISSAQFGHASAVWAAEQWADKWAANASWLIVNGNLNDRYKIVSAVFNSDPASSTISSLLKVFPNYVRVTVDRALPAAVSSAFIITSYETKAILVANKMDALDGSKRISDLSLVFEQPLFESGKLITATDIIPGRQEALVSGFSPGLISSVTSWTPGRYNSALGGRTIRVWPHKSHQRASQFYIGFSVNEALAYYGLLGVVISVDSDGEYISRRNNG